MNNKGKPLTWKEFWDRSAAVRNPIAATDRLMVSPEVYQLYSNEIRKILKLESEDHLLDIG